jgi:hypothetical protein
MGESVADELFWRDPFVAYLLPKEKQSANNLLKSPRQKTKIIPNPIRPMQNRGKLAWREFTGLFLQRAKKNQTERPSFLNQFVQLEISKQYETYPFRCIAFQTDGKMKFFEWFDFGFDVPLPLLQDPDGAKYTDKALKFATDCAETIKLVFTTSFGQKTRNSERFRNIKERMETDFWANLASEFRLLVLTLGQIEQRQEKNDEWLNTTIREAQGVFETAADATGDDGRSIRHIVLGKALCKKQLKILLNETKQGG